MEHGKTRMYTEKHGCHPRRLTGTAVPTPARARATRATVFGRTARESDFGLASVQRRILKPFPARSGQRRWARGRPCRGGNSCAWNNRLSFRVLPCFSVSHECLAPQNRAQKTRCCNVVPRKSRNPFRVFRVFRGSFRFLYFPSLAGVAPARYMPLKSNLNTPCGWARKVISGPKRSTLPFPTGASNTAMPLLR